MKILHLTIADPAGVAIHNAMAMMETYPEIEVRVIRGQDNYISYPKDLDGRVENIHDWVNWADLLHIHESGFYMMGKGYLPNKPVLMHFHNRRYGWHFDEWRRLCDENNYQSVVSTPNLTLLNDDIWLPSPRPDYQYLKKQPDTFTVCQAPTNRKVKSTKDVINASQRANTKLDLIEQVNYWQSIKRKAKSSLMIDQFELGYGLNAVEAWSLGLPVIGNATPEILERIEELIGYVPFEPTPLEELQQSLIRFQQDQELYDEVAERGRKTYEDLHSYEAVATKTLEVYEQVTSKKLYPVKRIPEIEISVIVPCYGYSQYLPDLVQSLDRQTFNNWEAIIVNDADDKFNVPKWLEDHSKIEIIHNQENQGIAGTINRGIEQAKGKYITVLSADDLMRVNRLQELWNLAENNPHRFIYDNITVFGEGKGRIRGVTKTQSDLILSLPEYDFDTIIHKNGIHAGSLYPYSAWVQSGGYPEIAREGREDHAYNVAMGVKGWCGVHTDKPLYLYRRHSANRTNFDSNAEWQQIYRDRMRTLYPKLYEGVLPMGCCGGKKNKTQSNNQVQSMTRGLATMKTLPGSKEGFTKVQYIGSSTGDQSWWVGGTRYYLGGKRNIGFVANEDLKAMLDMNGGNAFKVHKELVAATPQVVEPVFDTPESTEEETYSEINNPGSFNVSELKRIIPNLSSGQVTTMLYNEKLNKNRSTVIEALENKLELA